MNEVHRFSRLVVVIAKDFSLPRIAGIPRLRFPYGSLSSLPLPLPLP